MKHPGQMAAHKCMVCQKPICPKCMEMFGYLCSAYCKGKAGAEKLDIPVYAGQKSVAERKYWRKTGLIAGVVVLVVGGIVGAWTWYEWVGSAPRVAFSVRLENGGYSGQVRMVGSDQVVFLHGGRVARHDMKANKQVWLHDLVDRQKIAKQAADHWEPIRAGKRLERVDEPKEEEIRDNLERWASAAYKLYVHGSNIWISSDRKLTRFDWDTGQPGKEVALEVSGQVATQGNDLLVVSSIEPGYEIIQHIDLVSGESRKEEIGKPSEELLAAREAATKAKMLAAGGSRNQATARRPAGATPASRGGSNQPVTIVKASLAGANTRALNPAQIASEVQSLSKPERIALPAVLAANANQQRLAAQMEDLDEDTDAASIMAALRTSLKGPRDQEAVIRDGNGFIQFDVKLLEKKEITRQAMKAPPQKSVLDGDLRVTQTAELANEMLNEWQRDRTGGLEVEDVSRYQVTLGRLGEKGAGWTGEVIGPPKFIPVKTVNVVTAGKTLIVLDKNHKKLWQSELGFPIETSFVSEFEDNEEDQEMSYGDGPCVEREGTFYVFDQGVLTAFDMANGTARWRLPSVGISGLHFDGKGMLYVNTTTASPESLKYSQQIDVTDKTHNVVMKIDPASGKTLWTITGEGMINYVSGKFIYTVERSSGGESALVELIRGSSSKSSGYLRIKRINPSNGRVMWEHFQQRAPLDIQINGKTFQVLFRKEMQVLKFLSL